MIHFRDMHIGDIRLDNDRADIRFDYAIIVKNMDAADEDTRWHGRGLITVEDVWQQSGDLPDFPATLTGADIRDNQMVHRDEISIPFSFHGSVSLVLRFKDADNKLTFAGERMSLALSDHEKYIEHIKAG